MKKRDFISGIICLLIGIACLITALTLDTKLDSLLFGFTGACIVPGILSIRRYLCQSSPENKERYQETPQNDSRDEMKDRVRDRAGRYAYVIGLYSAGISVIAFAVLDALTIIDARMIILYLGGYLIVQIITERIVFDYFMKKYK